MISLISKKGLARNHLNLNLWHFNIYNIQYLFSQENKCNKELISESTFFIISEYCKVYNFSLINILLHPKNPSFKTPLVPGLHCLFIPKVYRTEISEIEILKIISMNLISNLLHFARKKLYHLSTNFQFLGHELLTFDISITVLNYSLKKKIILWMLTTVCFFFCFCFFIEWEHRTGTMCPFSSLHPLKKGKEV